MREIPFSGIQLPCYEYIKRMMSLRLEIEESEFTTSLVAINGSMAGSIAALLTTPIDVIKTKQMTSRLKVTPTLKEIFLEIIQKEGYAGFMKAWHVRTASLAIGSVFYFSTYEYCKQAFTKMWEGDKNLTK